MNKKIFFFDVDGTLLDHEKQLPDSTKEAVKKVKEAGHEAAIATGRSPFHIHELMEKLEIETYVSFNGQYVVVKNDLIYTNPLNQQALSQITEIAKENKHPIVYLDEGTMMANVEDHPHIKQSVEALKVDEMVNYDPNYFKERNIYQSWLICTEEQEAAYMHSMNKLKFFRWHPYAIDVLPYNGSKAKGIEKVVEHFGLGRQNVYAFGDGLNDMEMFHYAGTSVAMGNSPDKLKRAASYVTKNVEEDGLLEGLKVIGEL